MFGTTSLTLVLMIVGALLPAALMAAAFNEADGRFPQLSDEESWQKLPPAEKGGGQALPSWAEALAGPMPRTTAALLRLDLCAAHAQARSIPSSAPRCAGSPPMPTIAPMPKLMPPSTPRAPVWTRASSTRCVAATIRRYSPAEKSALEFAHKMTVNSSGVTDAEFSALVSAYGERQTAAMVLLMAYSNFQDRLLLSLGSPLEAGGPRPPVEVVFAPEAIEAQMVRPLPSAVSPLPKPTGKDLIEDDPDWATLGFDELQALLEKPATQADQAERPQVGRRRTRPAPGLHAAEPDRLEPGLPWLRRPNWRPRGRP